LGDRAEALAVDFLKSTRLTILGRNVRVGPLEVDVLAKEGPVLVLIEIRMRGTNALTSASSSIDWKKRRNLRYAADRLWRKTYRYDPSLSRIRFDVICVRVEGTQADLEYIRGAF
jgi:putative endonuclease